MRGRVAAFLVLLTLSVPVLPQCSWTPRESASFRTTAYDLALDGALVWLATGYGVQLLDSHGTRIADAVALPGVTRVIRADGQGRAYVGSGSRLYVLRRDGTAVTIVHFADVGAPINDILLLGSYLFVATTNGLAHFDVLDPLTPFRTNAILPTSGANVTSLATASGKLYAADGDATIEEFSVSIPSIPQHTGELASVVRATAVHAGGDGRLFVSDAFGQNTDIFSGATAIGRLPVGANSFASAANGVHFVAGPDRTLRAVDFTSTSVLKEIFEHQLPPTGGTDNVIHAIARSGDTLYVAAGDIGLAIFDTRTLASPYPLVSYRSGGTASTVVAGDRAWFGDGVGTITEQKIVASGLALTTERTWTGGAIVHDVDGTTLLTSAGSAATLWSLASQIPAATSTSTFRATVKAAAIRDSSLVALLDDGSVWLGGATPQQVTLPVMVQLARTGSTYLFVEARDEGKTVLHAYPTTDFAALPRRVTIDGVAIGTVALDATRAAVFTFRGVSVVQIDSGAVSVVPDSDRVIPRQLAFSGNHLLVLDKNMLYVYEGNALVREQFLPADAVMLDTQGGIAVAATTDGTLAANYLASQPTRATPFSNTFYTKLAAASDRAYLLAPGRVDVYALEGNALRYLTGILAGGSIDLAATDAGVFTLSASGVVTAYSRQGAMLRQTTLNEGPDAQPLAIRVAGNAVWVALSKGCLSGGCQQKTLVFDPVSLTATASLNGGVKDVVTSGARAYALFDFPAEVRVLNITDPRQPSEISAIAAPTAATSVAASIGTVYVTGDKLYEYTESTMLLKTAHFAAVNPDKAQQVRVEGTCLVVSARSASPELYATATLTPVPSFESPATVRAIASQPDRLLLLTTHSLEVWSSSGAEPRKRRAAR